MIYMLSRHYVHLPHLIGTGRLNLYLQQPHLSYLGYELIYRPYGDDIKSQTLVYELLNELGIEVEVEEEEDGLPF